MTTNIPYPLYKDDVFATAKKIMDYEKMKDLHNSVVSMIEIIDEKINSRGTPRNPRQTILQQSDKNTLRVLRQRKIRFEEKMILLENSIKADIKSKGEV